MEVDEADRTAPSRPAWPATGLGDRIRPWVEWFGLARLLGSVAAVVLVVAGGWWLLRAPSPPPESRLPYAAGATTSSSPAPAGTGATTTSSSAPAVVVVHVAGAVATPGVYELPGGARVHDAVDAAGGVLPTADPTAVNLAAPVTDGERVYVTAVGEAPPAGLPSASPGPVGGTAPSGPIDVNRATAEELDALPGVGPATAAAIVAHRDEHGPFATVDDLDEVSGIGPAKLEGLRDLVTT